MRLILNLSRKRMDKEFLLRMLFLAMISTTLLMLPSSVRQSSASPENIVYSVSVSPARLQEGLGTNITLSIRDATANTTYAFKMNVTSPADVSYFFNFTVSTNGAGLGNNMTQFPSDFTNATTNYVGIYRIAVNETLATSSFTVGLTDKTKYFRSETVNIRSSGYAPNETVIMDLKFNDSSVATFPRSINASSGGVVTSSWAVPENASLGVYTLTVSNATVGGTFKTPADVQVFTVEGLVDIQVKNPANQTVEGVLVEVWNASSGLYLNLWNETDETGRVQFVLLSAGNYTFKALWKGVEVGLVNQTITGNAVLSLTAWLSNIKITVTDEAVPPNPLPLIELSLMSNSGIESFITNLTGSIQLTNMFTNISYLIEARRYGFLFSEITLKNLTAGWNNVTIIAPTYTMKVHVVDSKDAAAQGLKVEAYEWSSGISDPLQSRLTDPNGNFSLSLTFGKYRLRFYQGSAFLNEVAVDLIENKSFVVRSDVYNVDLNVLVVDYFGQPIPNVLVEFQRKVDSNYQTTSTQTTGAGGVVRFVDMIGGESRVSVSVAGRPSQTQYLYLTGPVKDVVFKIDGYVAVLGSVLETSQLVTIILLLILIASLIIASTYKKLPRLLQRRKK